MVLAINITIEWGLNGGIKLKNNIDANNNWDFKDKQHL